MSVCSLCGATFVCVQTTSIPLSAHISTLFFSQLPPALNWSSLPSVEMIYHSTFSCDPAFVINPQQWDSRVLFSPCSALSSPNHIISIGGKCNGSPHRRPIISAYDHMHQNSASFLFSHALPPFLPLISVVCFYPAGGVSLSPTAREPWH